MRNLIVRRIRGARNDRGAIGVLVAILIGGGVLFGMGALVIDVGQLYQNRAELQNGADAAALAIAKSCVEGTCTPSIATGYADANASGLTGGTAYVNLVCGVNGAGTVGTGACASGNKHCAANPPPGANYADVETSTELANGSHLLPPVFARTLAGNGNYQGTTVYACSQAEWGAPLTANTVGFTISACTWDQATSGTTGGTPGTSFAPPPPYPPNPSASFDQVVYLKGGPTGSCSTEPNGAAAPGNFGWTSDPNGNCTVSISSNSYGGSTGNSVSHDCQTLISNAWSAKTVLYVPIYVSVSATGNNATYTLKGFAAFVITGYSLPSFNQNDWITGEAPCSGSSSCISGFFTHALIPASGSLGGTNLGADIIKLTG
jgi:Flp pilus assembly protein TadG